VAAAMLRRLESCIAVATAMTQPRGGALRWAPTVMIVAALVTCSTLQVPCSVVIGSYGVGAALGVSRGEALVPGLDGVQAATAATVPTMVPPRQTPTMRRGWPASRRTSCSWVLPPAGRFRWRSCHRNKDISDFHRYEKGPPARAGWAQGAVQRRGVAARGPGGGRRAGRPSTRQKRRRHEPTVGGSGRR